MAKKGDTQHILVIRLSAMGDVAMTVPALLALKKNYPKTKITVLTKPHFEPIFSSIEGVSVFSAEVRSRHKGIFGLWKLYRELSQFSITHVADLHNVLRSKVLGFFFRLRGIPVKKINKGRAEKKALTRAKDKLFQPLKLTIERYLIVFNALGFPLDTDQKYFLPRHEFPQKPIHLKKTTCVKYIGVAPFAAYTSKMYRLDLMEKVIQKLKSQIDCEILLFGGGERETELLKKLESKFDDRVHSVAGNLIFKEELALISNLDVMLAMDSGNGHLAANYGVPVVTIWGVTHPYAGFVPYDQPMENSLIPNRNEFPFIPTSVYGNKYPKAYAKAINSISSDSVVEKIVGVLNSR